jgi:hypothetical protein
LHRARPVTNIQDALVYSVHEVIQKDADLDLARQAGSDVWIRGWFKWSRAIDYEQVRHQPAAAHGAGALFGAGITCSALYDGENGLRREQWEDLATRGPRGELVKAWGQNGVRHGSLSNPAYRDYLFSWCRRQMDAGADYLFMDEINAVLGPDEGFDDYAIADFRRFLPGQTAWPANDPRWQSIYGIGLTNRDECPDGTLNSFLYRAYLLRTGHANAPHAAQNPLAKLWQEFRVARDDQAWRELTTRIRAHAQSRGRPVWISGNGLTRHVDLQMLGVWGLWRTRAGRVDLAENQLEAWHSTVAAGCSLAGRRVPVVFFHDWGFNGFPWVEVPVADRRLWLRTRAAEIYAAGARFGFPVDGPWGPDAESDGLMEEIIRQTSFYQRHRDLYLQGRLLGFEPLTTPDPGLSLALWQRESPPALVLHVINRQSVPGALVTRSNVTVRLPLGLPPKSAGAVSPDWSGLRPVRTAVAGNTLAVTLPTLEAYAVAILDYPSLPAVKMAGHRMTLQAQWARPERNEFMVNPEGWVEDLWALSGLLQGRLHQHLRNPPTFLVNLPKGGRLRAQVAAVATQGARLEWQVDGRPAGVLDLRDRDGKNDSAAQEFDEAFAVTVPPGRHRVTLDNTGADWAVVKWLAVEGEIAPYTAQPPQGRSAVNR